MKYVLKSFNRKAIIESDQRIEEVVNERDLLKATKYPNLNRLVTTTKNEE